MCTRVLFTPVSLRLCGSLLANFTASNNSQWFYLPGPWASAFQHVDVMSIYGLFCQASFSLSLVTVRHFPVKKPPRDHVSPMPWRFSGPMSHFRGGHVGCAGAFRTPSALAQRWGHGQACAPSQTTEESVSLGLRFARAAKTRWKHWVRSVCFSLRVYLPSRNSTWGCVWAALRLPGEKKAAWGGSQDIRRRSQGVETADVLPILWSPKFSLTPSVPLTSCPQH